MYGESECKLLTDLKKISYKSYRYFKPNLAAKLQKRWLKFGYLWIGNTDGKSHLARILSEPIELDWKAVASR